VQDGDIMHFRFAVWFSRLPPFTILFWPLIANQHQQGSSRLLLPLLELKTTVQPASR
jgi:hypothetical protein